MCGRRDNMKTLDSRFTGHLSGHLFQLLRHALTSITYIQYITSFLGTLI